MSGPRTGGSSAGAPGTAATSTAAPRVRRAVIALGSNLGDRETLLREAVRAVDATPGITVVAASAPV